MQAYICVIPTGNLIKGRIYYGVPDGDMLILSSTSEWFLNRFRPIIFSIYNEKCKSL